MKKENEILLQRVKKDIDPSVFSHPHTTEELQFLYEIKRAENLERNLLKCNHLIDRPVAIALPYVLSHGLGFI